MHLLDEMWIASISDPLVQLAAWQALDAAVTSPDAAAPGRMYETGLSGIRRFLGSLWEGSS